MPESVDRLPTVSAAQALVDLAGDKQSSISTSLPALDSLLHPGTDPTHSGGIQKGHVAEVWSAPGVGKTALGYAFRYPSSTAHV
jgi:RecA/RadA recombinase